MKQKTLIGTSIGFFMGFIPNLVMNLMLVLGGMFFYPKEFVKPLFFGLFFALLAIFPTHYYKKNIKAFKWGLTILIIIFIIFLVYNVLLYLTFSHPAPFGSIADNR